MHVRIMYWLMHTVLIPRQLLHALSRFLASPLASLIWSLAVLARSFLQRLSLDVLVV
jgi:hypothetical protein